MTAVDPLGDVDLRRAARMVAAQIVGHYDVVRLVMVEVQRERRWQQFAMAMSTIAHMLTVDEPAKPHISDVDGFVLWLHSAVEQVATDGDAWWVADDDDAS